MPVCAAGRAAVWRESIKPKGVDEALIQIKAAGLVMRDHARDLFF